MVKTPLIKLLGKNRIPFKYCSRDVDRYGNERFYIRLPNERKYRMLSPYLNDNGSITKEFVDEYHRVMSGDIKPVSNEQPKQTFGTISWLVIQYYQSKAFLEMSPATKKDKRSVYERYCETVGHLPFKKLRKEDINASQMKRASTPGAADKFVKYIKTLFNWAMNEGLTDFNPANGITKINKSDGFHSWTETEILSFRQFYPFGTTARLALELMLNLGIRRSDLVTLGWKNITNERIEFIPKKGNHHRSNNLLSLPITAELQAALTHTQHQHDQPTFLITEYGKPFTSNGFGNKMRQWCDDAHLPQCSSHGLRKAAAAILAEAGATEAQLMAIFGWSDAKMAQHYTKAAQSKRMIDAGFKSRENYLAQQNVPLLNINKTSETKMEKNYEKSISFERNGRPGGT